MGDYYMEVVRHAGDSGRFLHVSEDFAAVDDVIRVSRTGEMLRVVGVLSLTSQRGAGAAHHQAVITVHRGVGIAQPRLSWWRRLLGQSQGPRGPAILKGDELVIVGSAVAKARP